MRPLLQHWQLVFALLASSGAGCATLKSMVGMGPLRPKVSLQKIVVQSASLAALHLSVRLRVDNPNDFELQWQNLVYTVERQGVIFARGMRSESTKVPAQRHAYLDLPIVVSMGEASEIIEDFLRDPQDFRVDLRATADFMSSWGKMSVLVDESYLLFQKTK